ncbi:hypothetical protein VTN31DRAFT_4864 [Thermomyces dupontii]|uniref:uncharacterized protein n=1 Tax=Talaromyces thermophilus TaxID=28565 RepID=UPI00374471D1
MEEESKRKIRDSIIGQIPDLITSLLDTIGSAATRILGDTPNSLLDPSDYLGSIRPFVSRIEESLHDLRPDIQTRFLALNVYPGKHAYFVLDVNNVDYDYETAHSNLAPIPVYVLRLSRRPKVFRQRQLDDTLAKMLAEMHNGHGYDPLPFVEDYHKTVEYRNPRSLQSRLIGTTQPTLSA